MEKVLRDFVIAQESLLNKFKVFETHSRDEMLRYFRSVLDPHELLSGHPSVFYSAYGRASLGDAPVHLIRYDVGVSLKIRETRGAYRLGMVLDGSCLFFSEGQEPRRLYAGDIFVANPGTNFYLQTSGNFCCVNVHLDRNSFAHTIATEMDTPLPEELKFFEAAACEPSLINFMRFFCNELGSREGREMCKAVGKSYMRTMQILMLECIPNSLTNWLSHLGERAAAPYYVFAAEKFMMANFRDSLRIDDIARVADVNVRTLYNGFRRFRGETPMGCLKRIRLTRVRTALSQPAKCNHTITDIAFDHGFNHLSKFSTDYRSRFGELPSETLRRARA